MLLFKKLFIIIIEIKIVIWQKAAISHIILENVIKLKICFNTFIRFTNFLGKLRIFLCKHLLTNLEDHVTWIYSEVQINQIVFSWNFINKPQLKPFMFNKFFQF